MGGRADGRNKAGFSNFSSVVWTRPNIKHCSYMYDTVRPSACRLDRYSGFYTLVTSVTVVK